VDRANLVFALLYSHGPREALAELRSGAAEALALGDVQLSIDVLEGAACALAALGDASGAALVLGSAQRRRDELGFGRAAPDQAHVDRFIEAARAATPAPDWERATQAGAGMSLEEALAAGLAERGIGPPRGSPERATPERTGRPAR
jgi:hypothetical protein